MKVSDHSYPFPWEVRKKMRKVAIIGCGMTKFGKHENATLMDLLTEASLKALDDSNLDNKQIDAVYVGNMGSLLLNHQTGLATALTANLNLLPAAVDTVQNGTASGSSAIKNGFLAVASGYFDKVLVAAGEKMRVTTGNEITDFIATMTHPEAEYAQGVTLPSLAGMFTRLYMHKYGVERKHLAMVAAKNHKNALKNPYAHIHKAVTVDDILYPEKSGIKNPVIADPLRLYDCCPVSDGAASVILCPLEEAKKYIDTPVEIIGFGQATEVQAVHEREDPTEIKSLRIAAKKAFEIAKVEPKDVDVAELHDAFTILEIAESEEAGFFKKGEGHKALEEGLTEIGGKIPINPSGGLKARGHPVGATGAAQIVELVWQLRNEAGERQVENAEIGFSCNFFSFGSNVVAFVLKRGD